MSALEGLTSGSHSWLIDDVSMVSKMLNCQCGTKFTSAPFRLMGLEWRLEIFPNGKLKQYEGFFMIYLRLLRLRAGVSAVQICRMFRVIENQCSNIWMFRLAQNEYAYWNKKCPLAELQEMALKTITIYVEVTIQKLWLSSLPPPRSLSAPSHTSLAVHDTRRLVYKLSEQELSLFADARSAKQMSTDILESIWSISWYPNGCKHEYKGFVSVGLNVWSWSDFSKLTLKYKIGCVELGADHEVEYTESFDPKHTGKVCERFLSWQHLLGLESLTFVVDITVLEIEEIVISENESKIEMPEIEIADAGRLLAILSEPKLDITNDDSVHNSSAFAMNDAAQRVLDEEVQQQMDALNLQCDEQRIELINTRDQLSAAQTLNATLSSREAEDEQNRVKLVQTVEELRSVRGQLQAALSENGTLLKRLYEAKMSVAAERESMETQRRARLRRDAEAVSAQRGALSMAKVMAVRERAEMESDLAGLGERVSRLKSGQTPSSLKVRDWLRDIVQLPQYARMMIEAGFDDLELIALLNGEDLERLAIEKLGHRKRLMKAVRELRPNVTRMSPGSSSLSQRSRRVPPPPQKGRVPREPGHRILVSELRTARKDSESDGETMGNVPKQRKNAMLGMSGSEDLEEEEMGRPKRKRKITWNLL